MSACLKPEEIAALLGEVRSPAQDILSHLEDCKDCREKLQQLALARSDDRAAAETLLKSTQLNWPQVDDQATVLPTGTHDEWPTAVQQRTQLLEERVGRAPGVQPSTEFRPLRDGHSDFADYRLMEKIGAGGMGVVYKARQKSANRIVALKIIRPEQLEAVSEERRQTWLNRFRSEAQAAARLEHDHVVRVYDVGEYEGVLFYSMQYIEGQSLAELVRDEPIENRRLATLLYEVALAVDHAHQFGILHRDLKPQNILIQQLRAGPSSGSTLAIAPEGTSVPESKERAYVADFGLVKLLEDDQASATRTGEIMGSPSYMSPEQAQDASRCTQLSDVYSLGATLYDAMAGRPPFRAASPLVTLRQVIEQAPVPPRELNPAIDLDLQTITLKALEKEPARRYASARHMAEDLQRYIQGKPIEARPIGRVEKAARWCRRNPTIAVLATAITLLLMAIAGESVYYAQQQSAARQEAEQLFITSLDVIDQMLAEFGDESLAHVPQMETVRRELLQKALTLYSDLARTNPTNPELRSEFARTQHRIAQVYDLLGQHSDAQQAYHEAIRHYEDLLSEAPENRALQVSWANSHALLGETLRKISPEESEAHFHQAMAKQAELHRADPHRAEYRRDYSRTLNNLGLLYTETGNYEAAERHLRSSIEHLQVLSSRKEAEPVILAELYADLGRSQINLGVLLRKLPERAADAKVFYENAVSSLAKAVAFNPNQRDFEFRLAIATNNLANFDLTEVASGADQALKNSMLAMDRFEKLVEAFPGIPVYQYELANSQSTSAVAQATLGKYHEAIALFEVALRTLRKLNQTSPTFANSEARVPSLTGRVQGGLAYVHSVTGDWKKARELVLEAIKHQQLAVDLHAENPEFASLLEQHQAFLKLVEAKTGELESLGRQEQEGTPKTH